MIKTEAAALCRYLQACCPQQKFDQFTSDAWFDLLADMPFGLAKLAAQRVASRQPFVSPSEIIATAKAMRKAVDPHITRLLDETEGAAPADPDADWIAWCKARRERVAYLVDLAIATKAATFGDELVEQVTAVDADRLPLEPKPQLPIVDRKADIVQITERTGRSA
ncbi:MAG: hypothetical protein GX875_01315 [Propionibacterium sp.]|nr:hypothetical protein [Propionibacterium sp.]